MFASLDDQMKHDDVTAASPPATHDEMGRDCVRGSCSIWWAVLRASGAGLIFANSAGFTPARPNISHLPSERPQP